jgi:hypothetical protein
MDAAALWGRTMTSETEFLLASLRAATLRARLAATEFEMVGVGLRGQVLSYDDAVAWLNYLNLLDHVLYRPEHKDGA